MHYTHSLCLCIFIGSTRSGRGVGSVYGNSGYSYRLDPYPEPILRELAASKFDSVAVGAGYQVR